MRITPKEMIHLYGHGLFPMAESADSAELLWFDPDMRGILPLDHFKLSRSLRKFVLKSPFEIKITSDFEQVIRKCAEATSERPDTWINSEIINLYTSLSKCGFAHSVECWHEGVLVGGLYGVAIGGAFFGESMFSRTSNASKVALVHLIARLNGTGFQLLDTQFNNDHLQQFGCLEIPRDLYREKLMVALEQKCTFTEGASDVHLHNWLKNYQKP